MKESSVTIINFCDCLRIEYEPKEKDILKTSVDE